MHNTLVFHRGNQFNFNLQPLFKCYEETAYFYTLPNPENVMDLYDLYVGWRIKELNYTFEKSGLETTLTQPWQLTGLPEDVQRHVEFLLDMKPYITKDDLIDVMETFNMMYVDDYSILRNYPIEEVW
jgi:hypothetical protein